MRLALKLSLVAAALAFGCALEPVEIGQLPDDEEDPGEVTSGTVGHGWYAAELEAGVRTTVELVPLDAEFDSMGVVDRRLVIELLPLMPTSLPDSLDARVRDAKGEPVGAFVLDGAALRFDLVLAPGWRLELHADEPTTLELRAQTFAPLP